MSESTLTTRTTGSPTRSSGSAPSITSITTAPRQFGTEPFKIEDLEAIGPPVVPEMELYLRPVIEHPVASEHLARLARTAKVDGEPIGAYGVVELRPAVGTIWVWFSPAMSRYVRPLIRIARPQIEVCHEILGYRRLQVEIHTEVPSARRLARLLGFQDEGLMRNYGIGGHGDYYLMSRIWR